MINMHPVIYESSILTRLVILQQLNHHKVLILAIPPPADPTPSAVMECVHVFLNTKEILTLAVDQSAF